MLYPQQTAPSGSGAAGGGGWNVGADFGFNVGSETFRVQMAIAGLFLVALAAIVYAHKSGYRFSVKVD